MMRKNLLLYNAAMALVYAVKFIKPVDRDFAQVLLDKAQEYKNKIIIDKKLEVEVGDFEKRIKEGLL